MSILLLISFILFTVFSLGVMIVYSIDQYYDYALWGSYEESKQVVVQEVRYVDSYYGRYYVGYYLENNELEHLIIKSNNIDNSKLNITYNNNDKITINYKFKFNRLGFVIYDEFNYANIQLKENYEILNNEKSPKLTIDDFKTRRVFKQECIDKINYKDGIFTFYKLNNKLNSFSVKESEFNKLEFEVGDTKGHFACVHLNFMETYNKKIISEKYNKPVLKVTIPEGFNINSIVK